jgi:hypothetical protein
MSARHTAAPASHVGELQLPRPEPCCVTAPLARARQARGRLVTIAGPAGPASLVCGAAAALSRDSSRARRHEAGVSPGERLRFCAAVHLQRC